METLVLILRIASNLAPVPLLIIGWRHRRLLWWYALFSTCADAVTLVLSSLHLPTGLPANLFLLLEFGVFSVYYNRLLGFARPIRAFALFIATAFTTHTLAYGVERPDLVGASVLCIGYILYALLGYYWMLKNRPSFFPGQSEIFWTNTALIVYATGTCLLFLFYTSTLVKDNAGKLFWIAVFFSANVIKSLILAVATRVGQRYQWTNSA